MKRNFKSLYSNAVGLHSNCTEIIESDVAQFNMFEMAFLAIDVLGSTSSAFFRRKKLWLTNRADR